MGSLGDGIFGFIHGGGTPNIPSHDSIILGTRISTYGLRCMGCTDIQIITLGKYPMVYDTLKYFTSNEDKYFSCYLR